MSAPGDPLHMRNKELYLNGHPLNEPYAVHKNDYIDNYRDNFPAEPDSTVVPAGLDMLQHHVNDGELILPPNCSLALG